MLDVVGERGVSNVTVADVVSRCGVSRRTFYELFDDCEACLLAAFDEAIERVAVVVIAAYERSGPTQRALGWRERVWGGLVALLGFFDEEPDVTRLLIVESLGAGPVVLERRARVLAGLARVVDDGRGERKGGGDVPLLTAEGVVGAVLSVIHTRLVSGEPSSLLELVGPLMGMIVLPYLGPAVARRESERQVPKRRAGGRGRADRDPLRDVEMRLTYRTVMVLTALAAHPDSSNRDVGVLAGMHDQGQISKLLARLERLGLIENTVIGHAKGAANAWTLTLEGREVYEAIDRQSRPAAAAAAGVVAGGR